MISGVVVVSGGFRGITSWEGTFTLFCRFLRILELLKLRFMGLNGLSGGLLAGFFLCELQSGQHPQVVRENTQAHVNLTAGKTFLFHG